MQKARHLDDRDRQSEATVRANFSLFFCAPGRGEEKNGRKEIDAYNPGGQTKIAKKSRAQVRYSMRSIDEELRPVFRRNRPTGIV